MQYACDNDSAYQPLSSFIRDNNKYSMSRRQRELYAKVDRFFLVFFPILFLVFNLIYWTAYYYGEQARQVMILPEITQD